MSTAPERCTSMQAFNIFGTNDGNGGMWHISESSIVANGGSKEDFNELLKTFESVPKEEKLEWVKTHGGEYMELGEITETIHASRPI